MLHYLDSLSKNPEILDLKGPTHPTMMEQAAKDVRSLCQGYLGVKTTIVYFFHLVREMELDQHSTFLEKFWAKYQSAGFIQQSWLILAPEAALQAQEILGIGKHQFGLLNKTKRIESNHIVLLMRLHNIIVAEWSHVGKCRFWHKNNLNAPTFYKNYYEHGELVDFADYTQQHYFSEKGLWQKDAANWMSAKGQIPPL